MLRCWVSTFKRHFHLRFQPHRCCCRSGSTGRRQRCLPPLAALVAAHLHHHQQLAILIIVPQQVLGLAEPLAGPELARLVTMQTVPWLPASSMYRPP